MAEPVLILDLGGVCYDWSPIEASAVTPAAFKRFVKSPIWSEYERGAYSQKECYAKLAEEFGISKEDIHMSVQKAATTINMNRTFMDTIQRLRNAHSSMSLIAMSNISTEDFATLDEKLDISQYFDQVIISGEVGLRKPDLRFYDYVLEKLKISPDQAIFVDDSPENVDAARSLGMMAITHVSAEESSRKLHNAFDCSIMRGREWLQKNANCLFNSIAGSEKCYLDNWSQLLILEITQDHNIVALDSPARLWNFFNHTVQHAPASLSSIEFLSSSQIVSLTSSNYYPDDLDTTAVALSVLPYDSAIIHSILDEMLDYVSADGRLQVYFDHSRPRLCAAVAVNILAPFAQQGRLDDVLPTLKWIKGHLLHNAYIEGTQYYIYGEPFLFYVARLLSLVPPAKSHPKEYRDLVPILKERLYERIGATGDALSIAMRVRACQLMGLKCQTDYLRLVEMQELDGGWGPGELYRMPSSHTVVGNRGLSTALALKCIEWNRKSQAIHTVEGLAC